MRQLCNLLIFIFQNGGSSAEDPNRGSQPASGVCPVWRLLYRCYDHYRVSTLMWVLCLSSRLGSLCSDPAGGGRALWRGLAGWVCVLCGGYYINATTIIECLHSCEYCANPAGWEEGWKQKSNNYNKNHDNSILRFHFLSPLVLMHGGLLRITRKKSLDKNSSDEKGHNCRSLGRGHVYLGQRSRWSRSNKNYKKKRMGSQQHQAASLKLFMIEWESNIIQRGCMNHYESYLIHDWLLISFYFSL